VRIVFVVALTVVWAGVAGAHGRSLSYSRWELMDGAARVELRIPMLELTRLPPGEPPGAYVAGTLRLHAGDEPCRPEAAPGMTTGSDGWAHFHWSVRCGSKAPRAIRSDLLAGVVSSHVHFARAVLTGGEVRERFLVEADPEWIVESRGAATATPAADGVVRYVGLGVEHILTGWDHLAFLLALLLLASSLREVTTLVTGFTIGHSLTLGLAALGVIRPETAAVEALIGFSIALVAAENLWLLGGRDPVIPACCAGLLLLALVWAGALPSRAWIGLGIFTLCHFGLLARDGGQARVRAAVAFAFGLVHGFGFAGVLMEAELPTGRLVPALFGFNVGVELGQLFLVALAWPVLALLARRSGLWRLRVAEAASTLTLAVGVYCVVTRTWG
jgi:hypothetical protein